MTTERLRRRLDALAPATPRPTTWHTCVTPRPDMEGEDYAAWATAERAKHPPGAGLIFVRIIGTKETWR